VRRKTSKKISWYSLLSVATAAILYACWIAYSTHETEPHATQVRVENILMNSPVFETIARQDPAGFVALKGVIEQMISQGRSEEEITSRSAQVIRDFLPQYIARTSDWAVNGYARALLAEAVYLQTRDEEKCFEFLFPDQISDEDPDTAIPLIQSDLKHQLEHSLVEVIRDSIQKRQAPPDVAEMKLALADVHQALRSRFGDDVDLLQKGSTNLAEKKRVCQIGISLFDEVIALPSRESGLLLRFLLSGESATKKKTVFDKP
jgi:hypothetical protein